MEISKELVREIILEVLRQSEGQDAPAGGAGAEVPPLRFRDVGAAATGTNRHEVVVGLSPAFGTAMTKTIIGIPHADVLHEVLAGIEEEGLAARLVKVNKTADVGFIAHEAAKLSGSGIGIGIISRARPSSISVTSRRCRTSSCSPSPRSSSGRRSGRSAATQRNTPRVRPRLRCRCATTPWHALAIRAWRHCCTTRRPSTFGRTPSAKRLHCKRKEQRHQFQL